MAQRWLISVPVWGDSWVEGFCAVGLPALDIAVNALCESGVSHDDVILVVHTDQPDRIRGATGIRVEARQLPPGMRYFDCMSQAHREVFNLAMRGDFVVPLCADDILSAEALVTCKNVIGTGHATRAVACSAFRTISRGLLPSTRSRELHAWAWENRHPITVECTWPNGRSRDLSRMCFVDGDNVSARLLLPHPICVLIDGRPLSFTPTVDCNLLLNFDLSEIYLVTSPDELALVELSPLDKTDTLVEYTMAERLARGELRIFQPLYAGLLKKRVTLCGEMGADCGDAAVVSRILRPAG